MSLFDLFVGKGKWGMGGNGNGVGVRILLGMQMGYYIMWTGHRIVGDDVFLSNSNSGCFLCVSVYEFRNNLL